MKNKLSLHELKVKSFVTSVAFSSDLKGGTKPQRAIMSIEFLCEDTVDPLQCSTTNEPPPQSNYCDSTATTKTTSEGPGLGTFSFCRP